VLKKSKRGRRRQKKLVALLSSMRARKLSAFSASARSKHKRN